MRGFVVSESVWGHVLSELWVVGGNVNTDSTTLPPAGLKIPRERNGTQLKDVELSQICTPSAPLWRNS